MKNIECIIVFADESSKNLGEVELSTAISTFRSFPWEEELVKAEQSGCYPTISFGAVPHNKSSEYVNISGLGQNLFSVMIEAFIPGTILGFIPWKKSAFLDIDGLTAFRVEEFIGKIYKFSQQNLFEWIKGYNCEESKL